MSQKIQVFMAPGEADRQKGMEKALNGDKRFDALIVKSGLPVDLQFIFPFRCEVCKIGEDHKCSNCFDYANQIAGKSLHIELKEPQDFIQSVLNGHLYNQALTIREGHFNGCGVVMGDLDAIQDAIKKSAKGQGLRKDEIAQRIATTYARCKSFRKRSMLNGIPIFYQGDDSGFMDQEDPFQNIKELAYDFLLDGSMMGFGTRPANGERELGACNHLFSGMGPATLKDVLKEYKLALVPRKPNPRPVESLPGVGPKRAGMLQEKIVMAYGGMI